MQCVTLLLILVDTRLKELYLPMLVTGIHCTKLWVWKHVCQYQWSWDKPYSPGCNNLCPMLQFGSKHVYIDDVHIFKHCHEMTLFLLWIGTYCISCVVQQTSGVKDLSSLVRYDDSSLAAIRHVQSIIPVVRPRPNVRSHSVLFFEPYWLKPGLKFYFFLYFHLCFHFCKIRTYWKFGWAGSSKNGSQDWFRKQ